MRVGRGLGLSVFLLVLIGLAAPPADAGVDPAYERARRDDLARIDPSLIPVWDRANAAREAGRVVEARTAYEEITAKVPGFDAGHRRLCSVAGSRDAALTSCRTALSLKPSWENKVGLAAPLMQEPSGRDEARQLLGAAEVEAPSEVTVLAAQGRFALQEKDGERVQRYAARLEHVAPGDVETATFGTIAALLRGDAEAARASLERARAKGIDAELSEHLERSVEHLESEWTPTRIAKAFGLAIAGWLAMMGLLFASGTMLSRVTLRATSVDRATVSTGEAAGGTRTVRRAYSALITAASVFYYASLPIVGALVLAGVAALIYLCFAIGRIPLKLIAIVLVVGIASLWAILKGIYITLRPPKAVDPGEALSLQEHPQLARLLSMVAARIGTRTVDRVFVTPGTEMAVYERGGPLQTARGKGERCLVMGAGLLRGMPVGSFKGVLAHEFGHFKNEDTAGGALSLAVRRSMMQMLIALAQSGAAAAYNPAWLFATRYYDIFLRISQGASRLQEVLADRWAVAAYGSRPFVDGFEHVITRSVEHDVRTQTTLREVIDGDLAMANFYAYEAASPIDQAELEERVREARERPADPFDSHPSPKDRVEAALALAVVHAAEEGDDEDAWHLFEDRDELEQRLTDQICDAIAENHAVVIRRTRAAAEEERASP